MTTNTPKVDSVDNLKRLFEAIDNDRVKPVDATEASQIWEANSKRDDPLILRRWIKRDRTGALVFQIDLKTD